MTKRNNLKRHIFFTISVILWLVTSFLIKTFLIPILYTKDLPLLEIDYVKNYGAAFSLLGNHTNFLIVISVFILLFIIFYALKNMSKFNKIEFFFSAMLIAGILNNLFERIVYGYVFDYLKLKLINFPIFNIADIFICTGAFILICNILFNNEQKSE